MHQKQLKEVGFSHKDAPDASLPAHASSGPTTQVSRVYEEPLTLVCGPFYTQRSCDPTACACVMTSLVTSSHYKMTLCPNLQKLCKNYDAWQMRCVQLRVIDAFT